MMFGTKITFHDRANGGWFCNGEVVRDERTQKITDCKPQPITEEATK